MKRSLILLAVPAVLYALPKLLKRSNTQVHRINQHRSAP
jgi:hypothetical protein